MSGDLSSKLEQALTKPHSEQPSLLLEIGEAIDGDANGCHNQLVDALVALLDAGEGSGRERVEIGELLGRLGDPRIGKPADEAYWATVDHPESAAIRIGRYPVTNAEFQAFVDAGGYEDRALWSDEGWDWLQDCADPWPVRATAEASAQFVVANQPVVGVTFHEALAFARFHDSRLPRVDERVWVTRGAERRPYPWGQPFGVGNANTREEMLGRPCAVGLYVHDKTPEGVYDLAGNVAEWSYDDIAGGHRLIHPGAWDQPSLAAWAKALSPEAPDSRWAGLGFRLARD